MSEDTKEDLQRKLDCLSALNQQREISDKRYAMKLVEVVVWAMVSIILTAFILGIVKIVLIGG